MKKIFQILLAAVMVLTMTGVSALAVPAGPDLSQSCSLSVTVRETKTKTGVKGAKLAVYQVAYAYVGTSGEMVFDFTDDFAGCGYSLVELRDGMESNSARVAQQLGGYAERSLTAGWEKTTDAQGKLTVSNLEAGLYLVAQTGASDDYSTINPFLVTMPQQENGEWVYDVDATPKAGTVEHNEETPGKKPPKKTSGNGTKKPGTGTKLPQTGQLWWPVCLLAAGGVVCFAWGWLRREKD